MLIEIKCRFTHKVLFSGEYESTRAAVQAAVRDGANLDGANLYMANLDGANLYMANLNGANLNGANLNGANLNGANLNGANLNGANLNGANLNGASLNGANLYMANLNGASLNGASLNRANLNGASLNGASLNGIRGDLSCSHELLAQLAVRFDPSLVAVAAMIAGRLVGCWGRYTSVIRQYFGEAVMRRLWQAWSLDKSWGVVEKMRKHGWPEPDCNAGNEVNS